MEIWNSMTKSFTLGLDNQPFSYWIWTEIHMEGKPFISSPIIHRNVCRFQISLMNTGKLRVIVDSQSEINTLMVTAGIKLGFFSITKWRQMGLPWQAWAFCLGNKTPGVDEAESWVITITQDGTQKRDITLRQGVMDRHREWMNTSEMERQTHGELWPSTSLSLESQTTANIYPLFNLFHWNHFWNALTFLSTSN